MLRLHEHTQANLGMFEQLYGGVFSPNENKLLRTALLLQDSGKSLAVALTGNNSTQSDFNVQVAENVLLGVNETVLNNDEKRLIVGLVGQDIIGGVLQGKITEQEGAERFEALCQDFPAIDRTALVGYVKVLFACDAGAYTSDAQFIDAATGVARSLHTPLTDHLYQKPGDRITRLKPSIVERIDKLTSRAN